MNFASMFFTQLQELNNFETSPSSSFVKALQQLQEFVESNPQRAYLYNPYFCRSSGLAEAVLPRAHGQHWHQAQFCSQRDGMSSPEHICHRTSKGKGTTHHQPETEKYNSLCLLQKNTKNVLLGSPKSKSPSEL